MTPLDPSSSLLKYSLEPERMSARLMYYVLMYAAEVVDRKQILLNFVADNYKAIEARLIA